MTNGESSRQPKKRRGLLLAGLGAAAAAGGVGVWQWQRGHAYPHGTPLAVNLAQLPVGQLLTLEWQQKPVWVLRRTEAEVVALAGAEPLLTDPDSRQSVQPPGCVNRHRSLRSDVFVALGVCTHQGCTPALQAGKGFICPCHASHYDLAGRVFKAGPAPANLTIPAYHFAGVEQLIIGTDG